MNKIKINPQKTQRGRRTQRGRQTAQRGRFFLCSSPTLPLCSWQRLPRDTGATGCVKTGLSADANKPTSFYLMKTEAVSLREEGLPGEEDSLEEGETADGCIKVSAV